MKFRKKSVVVEAYRLPAAGEDVPDSFYDWCDKFGFTAFESDRDEGMLIHTLEGVMRADPGDWIIKGVKGEFYPVKPDIFAATYEPVSDDAPSAPQAEPMADSDADYWLRNRQPILDAIERAGFMLMSNASGFWLHPRGTTDAQAEPSAALIRAYNSGYMQGHHDTVESCFTDIHQSDMDTFHADLVAELGLSAAPQAEPCIGNDSACPCQDGDACHYKDAADGTKAWPVHDVLVERRRQIEVEGWTPEHDDGHVLGEIAALAAFYAVPDGVHEWDFSSTGYGATLAEALLPNGWTAKAGEDRRRDLVKAGALILAEIERLDRMGGSDAE